MLLSSVIYIERSLDDVRRKKYVIIVILRKSRGIWDMDNKSDKKIYLLYHMYEYGEDEDEEIKFLGIYSSEQEASKAMERYYKLAGFREYPKEFFIIDDYVVNEDTHWKEGFVNTADLDQDFEILTDHFNKWLGIDKSPRESWEDNEYYNALCNINEVMYKVRDIRELAEHIQKAWSIWLGDNSKSFDDYIEIAGNVISERFYDKYN